jgi:hypothetical protein
LRHLDLTLAPRAAAAWEALLAKGSLSQLTHLSVSDLPSSGLQALLPPGRLPLLGSLKLYGFPTKKAEIQGLFASPLLRQLQRLVLATVQEKAGPAVLRGLTRSGATAAVRDLGLNWKFTADQVRTLTATRDWPQLTALQLGVLRLEREGWQALAAWPVLGQLRGLTLQNGSFGEVAGVELLVDSPHLGPLLRVDIHNGTVGQAARTLLRQGMGGRFSDTGRKLPRVLSLGGWGRLFEEDDD